ncbi:putative ribonuclease H-like domain-containing protein [Tanacetum coccineum]
MTFSRTMSSQSLILGGRLSRRIMCEETIKLNGFELINDVIAKGEGGFNVSTFMNEAISKGFKRAFDIVWSRLLVMDFWKHFTTLSLDELRSPDFNLFSDQEYSEEEVTETMAKTMEQYMGKTLADYGSGVVRPKIKDNDNFELKGQFLKKLRTNTFSGSDHEDTNKHIEKVLEIVDLFHIPNITIDQVMLRAFAMSLTGATSRWLRNEPTGIPTRQILDLKGVIPSKTAADAKLAIQEIVEYSQKWYNGTSRSRKGGYRAAAPGFYQMNNANPSYQERMQSIEYTLSKFMTESAKRHEENSNLSKEIRASTDAAIQNQRASIKTLEIQIGQMSKEKDLGSFTLPCFINNVCFDNALVELGASVSVMPLSTYLNLGLGELAHTKLIVELVDRTVKYPKGITENVLVGIGKFVFPVDFIILDMPEDIKVPLILERPFLSTARAKIDVYKRKITLRVGEERIVFTSVKPASSLIKRVYMLSLRERMELDLEARLMGETLVLNRSLDPFFEDYIELNDLNEPFELRRNQGDDLMPTIEEGEVIEEFRTRDDELDAGIDDYPRALMNVPIFVGTFSVVMDFAVLENMDAYRDEGMGNVIFGEPFLREVGIKTRRFEGMITIYNGDDEVTYQMVRSHPWFKHHTNEKCNKIPPLLKVSEEKIDDMDYDSIPKSFKGFYQGVLI